MSFAYLAEDLCLPVGQLTPLARPPSLRPPRLPSGPILSLAAAPRPRPASPGKGALSVSERKTWFAALGEKWNSVGIKGRHNKKTVAADDDEEDAPARGPNLRKGGGERRKKVVVAEDGEGEGEGAEDPVVKEPPRRKGVGRKRRVIESDEEEEEVGVGEGEGEKENVDPLGHVLEARKEPKQKRSRTSQ